MNESETAVLMTTQDDGEAELVRGLLEGYGIPVQVVSDVTHSVYPLTVDGLGEVRILVALDDLERARQILDAHRKTSLPSGADTEDGSIPSAGEPGKTPPER